MEFKQNNDNIIVSFQNRKIRVVTPRSSTISKLAFIIVSLLMATAFITSITISRLSYAQQGLRSLPPLPTPMTFSFATAGDWGSNSNTTNTVARIIKSKVPLVIGLGDYCYCASPEVWWNGVVSPLKGIMFRGAEGNHEVSDSPNNASELLKDFGQKNWTSSFNYKNVHFVILDEEHGKPDGNALDKDLATARADPTIKWIIVAFHEPIYTSPSDHAPDENGIKSTVLPLFDKYHVDLVLQAHNHNYQRSSRLKADHQDPSGSVYMVVGTGGQDFYPLYGQASNMTKQFSGIHGFLKVDVSDTRLVGNFIANDGTIKDTFTINK